MRFFTRHFPFLPLSRADSVNILRIIIFTKQKRFCQFGITNIHPGPTENFRVRKGDDRL